MDPLEGSVCLWYINSSSSAAYLDWSWAKDITFGQWNALLDW